MSRSDGFSPSYVKLDIDPSRPIGGWKDGCRRCQNCNKSWPNLAYFSPSPCCNVIAGTVKTEKPDMSWPDAVKALLMARFERYYEKYNEGVTDEQLVWLLPNEELPLSAHELEKELLEIEQLISQN